ncbi:MAG: hypothetical protein K2H31_07655 [Lachnospiraceae bacterium]|nr:hypothetical protein [Lachnospiraceae bacterium]
MLKVLQAALLRVNECNYTIKVYKTVVVRAAVFVSGYFKTVVVQYRQINAGPLALQFSRSGTKLERTSLSTGGITVPVYDIVYIVQLGFGIKRFAIA